jgi:hypothetical protein
VDEEPDLQHEKQRVERENQLKEKEPYEESRVEQLYELVELIAANGDEWTICLGDQNDFTLRCGRVDLLMNKEDLCACTSQYLRDKISASNRVEMTPPCPPEVAAAVFAEALDIFGDPQDPTRLEILSICLYKKTSTCDQCSGSCVPDVPACVPRVSQPMDSIARHLAAACPQSSAHPDRGLCGPFARASPGQAAVTFRSARRHGSVSHDTF